MKSISRLAYLALAAVLFAPVAADAAEAEKVVVRNRKFTVDGKFEASANVGFTMVNYLTDHTNLSANLAYNLTETLALQLGGGYAISRYTNVAEAASTEVVRTDPNFGQKVVEDFADAWRMTWNTDLTARWAPIYGKINVAAELPIHFQAYLIAGGGIGGMTRDSLVYCIGSPATRKSAVCNVRDSSQHEARNSLEPLRSNGIKPLFIGGGGLRLFATNWAGLKLEVRDVAFPDSYRTKITRASAEQDAGAKGGGAPTQGEEAPNPGITHLVFFNIGASFVF
ncbi:MAG: outer membrane beta-barrel domain-containing protein [Myxococcales bacterium]